jgi:cytochrome c-type biogenesis protein CcmH
MAAKMRGQVRDLVASGYSEDQVLRYFERSYGEFVRLQPPLRGLNVLLWVLPGVLLLGGAAFVLRLARSPSTAREGSSAPSEVPKASEADPDLARYLERIRRDAGTPP